MLFSKYKILSLFVFFPVCITVLTQSTLSWRRSEALLIFMLFVRGNGRIPQAVHFIECILILKLQSRLGYAGCTQESPT